MAEAASEEFIPKDLLDALVILFGISAELRDKIEEKTITISSKHEGTKQLAYRGKPTPKDPGKFFTSSRGLKPDETNKWKMDQIRVGNQIRAAFRADGVKEYTFWNLNATTEEVEMNHVDKNNVVLKPGFRFELHENTDEGYHAIATSVKGSKLYVTFNPCKDVPKLPTNEKIEKCEQLEIK